MNLYQEALQIKDTMTANRHYLHQIPELGLDIPQTAAYAQAAMAWLKNNK